jgi:hypothetical protein
MLNHPCLNAFAVALQLVDGCSVDVCKVAIGTDGGNAITTMLLD